MLFYWTLPWLCNVFVPFPRFSRFLTAAISDIAFRFRPSPPITRTSALARSFDLVLEEQELMIDRDRWKWLVRRKRARVLEKDWKLVVSFIFVQIKVLFLQENTKGFVKIAIFFILEFRITKRYSFLPLFSFFLHSKVPLFYDRCHKIILIVKTI